MATIQIKGVPDDVHATLKGRAASNGQSLQEFVLGCLAHEARTPTVDELFSRTEQHTGGKASLKTVTKIVRAERNAR